MIYRFSNKKQKAYANSLYEQFLEEEMLVLNNVDLDIENNPVFSMEYLDELVEWKLLRIQLSKNLECISQKEREVLYLQYIKNMPMTKISKLYGVTKNRIVEISNRGIRKLKKLFQLHYNRVTI